MTEFDISTFDDVRAGQTVHLDDVTGQVWVVQVPGVHTPGESLKIVLTIFEGIDVYAEGRCNYHLEHEYGSPTDGDRMRDDAYDLLVRIREMIVRIATERDQFAMELATADRQSTTRMLAELSAARQQIREMRAGQA